MPYGTLAVDTVQSSTANTPPQFNDGNGTQVGTLCRAWVNFNGTGTVAIRASFNVSSITDNGTGDYTVNFTNAMPDANYSVVATAGYGAAGYDRSAEFPTNSATPQTTTSVRGVTYTSSTALLQDVAYVSVSIFR